MKMAIVFFIVWMHGCSYGHSEIRDFIPGVYVRSSQHEFGRERDTLFITIQNERADQYRLVRKWRYERLQDGIKINPEYKKKTTSAFYDEERKILEEKETGSLYSFHVTKRLLYKGATVYQKIK